MIPNSAFILKLSSLILAFISLSISFNTTTKTDSEYTEVLHFEYDISTSDAMEQDKFSNPHPKWVTQKLPNELNPALASDLFHLGYKRSEVRKRNFAELDSIFTCKPVDRYMSAECIPIYRDILIFRKRKTVVKIVQLCYDCHQSHFIGPWKDVKSFGQRGEFKKLKALLEK